MDCVIKSLLIFPKFGNDYFWNPCANFLKGLKGVSDKYIPFVLMFVSIAFSVAMLGLNVDSIIQGILIAGATVLSNQLIKQSKKSE